MDVANQTAESAQRENLRWVIGQGHSPLQSVAAVLASRYKLALIWELARGPKRFKELERALAPVTAKTLTRNLRDLERLTLVIRRKLDGRALGVEYRLSPVGVALRPHILSLCHWAWDHREAFAPGARDAADSLQR